MSLYVKKHKIEFNILEVFHFCIFLFLYYFLLVKYNHECEIPRNE